MRGRLLYLVPAMIFGVIAGYFLWGLDPDRDPREIPSVMIDQPVPEFELAPIEGMEGLDLAAADLRNGQVTLVNFFASWCLPCQAEHPILIELVERDGVRLVGINYKNDSCTKSVGSDFFNSLSHKRTFVRAVVIQIQAIGWLRKGCSSFGGGTVVLFPRIWMSSGECRLSQRYRV